MTQTPTADLASFVAGATVQDLPPRVRERATLILIDTVASAIVGGLSEEAKLIENTARVIGGPGTSPVVGREPMSPAGAVMLNGYLVTATTVCDVYRPALCHVTPEVFPPTLQVGIDRQVSGAQFLLAFALGLEVTTRVAKGANYESFRARGWHSPGVFGPFGGAAAAGKLAGLDELAMTNAFGLAGSQAAGTFAHWGTPTIKFHQARGAFSGYLAAALAGTGFAAGPEVLAAPDGGIYSTYSDGGRPEQVTEALGTAWELEQLSLRPWPLASSLQSVASALIHLVRSENLDAHGIEAVTVRLSPTVYRMHGELPWHDRFSALLSARYVTAVIIADGRCWLDQFTPQRLGDPAVGAYARDRVTVVADEDVAGTGATIELLLTDGRRLVDRRAVPHGDAEDPLNLADVTDKFITAAEPVIGEDTARAVLDRLRHIEDLPEVDPSLFVCGHPRVQR